MRPSGPDRHIHRAGDREDAVSLHRVRAQHAIIAIERDGGQAFGAGRIHRALGGAHLRFRGFDIASLRECLLDGGSRLRDGDGVRGERIGQT